MEYKIDLTPFIVEIFATSPKTYNPINRLYLKNKVKAYQASRASEHYNHKLFTEGSVEREDICKKTLGLLSMDDDEVEKDLIKILQHEWPKVFSLLKKREGTSFFLEDIVCELPPLIEVGASWSI